MRLWQLALGLLLVGRIRDQDPDPGITHEFNQDPTFLATRFNNSSSHCKADVHLLIYHIQTDPVYRLGSIAGPCIIMLTLPKTCTATPPIASQGLKF